MSVCFKCKWYKLKLHLVWRRINFWTSFKSSFCVPSLHSIMKFNYSIWYCIYHHLTSRQIHLEEPPFYGAAAGTANNAIYKPSTSYAWSTSSASNNTSTTGSFPAYPQQQHTGVSAHDQPAPPNRTPQESCLPVTLGPALTVRGRPRQRTPKLHRHDFSSDEAYNAYKRERVSVRELTGVKSHEPNFIFWIFLNNR